MEVTKEIFIEGNLIENSTIKLYYRGKFTREFSNEVFIVYGYGPDWKKSKQEKMTWCGDCFCVELKLAYYGEFNFCFTNDFGSWDNNNNLNYTILVNPKEYEIIFSSETINEVEDDFVIETIDEKKDEEQNNSYQEAKKRRKHRTKRRAKHAAKHDSKGIRIVAKLILSLILIFGIIYYGVYFYKLKIGQREMQNLLNTETGSNQIIEEIKEEKVQDEVNERMLKVKELNSQYPDLKAWIEIPNTVINFPVMHGNDNSYYIKHDYKKEYSKWGALFLDKDYDWSKPSSNLLIYGHNFSDGHMFSDLIKYRDEEFYNNHKRIRFTTMEEDAEYEIISVFNSRVYYKSEKDVFRYYFFVDAENEKEYNEYVENAKKASIYDIDLDAKYGEQLLTLSTCDYTQEDGRFVVVAKKISN